jgi:hypothetical protein
VYLKLCRESESKDRNRQNETDGRVANNKCKSYQGMTKLRREKKYFGKGFVIFIYKFSNNRIDVLYYTIEMKILKIVLLNKNFIVLLFIA